MNIPMKDLSYKGSLLPYEERFYRKNIIGSSGVIYIGSLATIGYLFDVYAGSDREEGLLKPTSDLSMVLAYGDTPYSLSYQKYVPDRPPHNRSSMLSRAEHAACRLVDAFVAKEKDELLSPLDLAFSTTRS